MSLVRIRVLQVQSFGFRFLVNELGHNSQLLEVDGGIHENMYISKCNRIKTNHVSAHNFIRFLIGLPLKQSKVCPSMNTRSAKLKQIRKKLISDTPS